MGLHIRRNELKAATVEAPELRGLVTKIGYGNDASLMYAERAAGYHSTPHRHAAEQLNYIISGEIHAFIGADCFRAEAGDFFRVPANAIHWAWNRGTQPVVLVECHTPGIGRDPLVSSGAAGLFASSEQADIRGDVRNEFVDAADAGQAAVEAKAFGPKG